jgi:hypothetical protein
MENVLYDMMVYATGGLEGETGSGKRDVQIR